MTKLGWITAVAAVGVGLPVEACRDASPLLAVGAPAPDVSGVDQHGTSHRLAEAAGRPTVVYFYPKDETPGCTKEACAFRDVWDRYRAAGVLVYGASRDPEASHREFAAHFRLPFPLIADPRGEWGRAFGVTATLDKYQRVTFLIGRDGKVARVYPKVDPGVHATQVLGDVAALR